MPCHLVHHLIPYSSHSGALIVHAKSLQLCPTLCDPMDCSPPGSCQWDSPGKNTGLLCPLLGDLPNSGIEAGSPAFPALQADSLPSETLRKPQDSSLLISKLTSLSSQSQFCKKYLPSLKSWNFREDYIIVLIP